MVSIPKTEQVKVPRVQTGHDHREVIRLRARVDKVDIGQRLRERFDQSGGVLVDLGVEVDVGGVPEGVDLIDESGVDLGVAVADADCHDAAKEVQVPGRVWRVAGDMAHVT